MALELTPYIRMAHYYETDQMGVVHHSNYIRWFEESRVDFLDKAGYSYEFSVRAGIDFAVLGVTCEYKSMVRFHDVVEIVPTITGLTSTRLELSYRVTDSTLGILRATGTTRHCFYHNRLKKPVSLKRELPDLYALFLEHMKQEGQRLVGSGQ